MSNLYTLLNSLAHENQQCASLDLVDQWIKSHLLSQDDAREAFDQGFVLVKNIYSTNLDLALIGQQQQGKPYVFLTSKGFQHLKYLDPNATLGKPVWQPEIRLKKFMQKYNNLQN